MIRTFARRTPDRGAEISERTCLPRSERAPERHHSDCATFSALIRDAHSHIAALGGSHFPNVSLWMARRFPGSTNLSAGGARVPLPVNAYGRSTIPAIWQVK